MSMLSYTYGKWQFGVTFVNLCREWESIHLLPRCHMKSWNISVISCAGACCGNCDTEGWARWPVDNPSRTTWARTRVWSGRYCKSTPPWWV
jgi:hypothetical protein